MVRLPKQLDTTSYITITSHHRVKMPKVAIRQTSETEQQIQDALSALNKDPSLSSSATGRKYGVPKTTSADRYRGKTKPWWDAHPQQQSLAPEEESAIEGWVKRLDDIGIPPKVSNLYQIVASILRKRNLPSPTPNQATNTHLGEHWISRFLDRHTDIAYRYSARVENERAAAGKPETINSFFDRLSEVRSRHKILPGDTYNVDEKGFAIGQAKQNKVLVRRHRKTSRIRQPGNQEWVSVIECVSAIGKVLPAYII